MALERLKGGEVGTPEFQTLINDIIQEIEDIEVEAGYQKPADGIPASDLAQAVQDSLALADTSVQGTGRQMLRYGQVSLCGENPTKIVFGESIAAEIEGSASEPFALDNGYTLIVNPDGDGDDTVTFAATAGTSTSGANPSTDISGGVDNKIKISVDGDDAEVAEITLAGANSGANIASALQTAIRALGGNKANVTCTYSDSLYVITSATKGTGSSVVITNAADHNVAEELKLGVSNGGTEAAGTGDAANIAQATAQEVVDAITTKATGWHAEKRGSKVAIISDTAGSASTLAVNAASTADTVLGITGSARGYEGLDYETDMLDANYQVFAQIRGTAGTSMAGKAISVRAHATTGFNLECETSAATDTVDLLIFGVPTE